MNWYKTAQSKAELRGEWWFRDGYAYFADGDIGDLNHAAMAIEWAQDEISSDFWSILEKYKSKLEEIGIWEKVGHVDFEFGGFKKAIDVIMDADYGSRHEGIYEDIVNEITAKHGADCTKAALKEDDDAAISWCLKQGWVRCHGNYLEVWHLTSSVMDTILEGIHSAYGDSALLKGSTEFSIELRSNKAFFPGIPLDVMEEKNMLSIAAFRESA